MKFRIIWTIIVCAILLGLYIVMSDSDSTSETATEYVQ